MKLAETGRLSLIALAFQTLPSLSRAEACSTVNEFNNYNATRTYSFPALRINGSSSGGSDYYKILEVPDKSWYITDRLTVSIIGTGLNSAMQIPWLNIGDSNTTNMGMCMLTTPTYSLGEYEFPKEVLERSVNDKGDCKIMLGEECVKALERHYRADATRSMMAGRCTGTNRNTTVPFQCASLIGGGDQWLGGTFAGGMYCSSFPVPVITAKCDHHHIHSH